MIGLMLTDEEAAQLYYLLRVELERLEESIASNKREDFIISLQEEKKILSSIHNRFRKKFNLET